MARTARASEWGHTAIFDDEMDVDDGATEAGRSARSTVRGGRAGSVAGRAGAARGVRLAADAAAADPQDLLEASTARQLVRSAAGAGGRPAAAGGAAAADFPRGDDGKMVIDEEEDPFGWTKKRKGKRWVQWVNAFHVKPGLFCSLSAYV